MQKRSMPVDAHSLFRTVFDFMSRPLPTNRHDETQARANAIEALEEIQSLMRRLYSRHVQQLPNEELQERMARAMAFAYYQAFVVFSHIPKQEGLVESLVETGWKQWMCAAKHHLQMQISKAVVDSEEQAKAAREAYLLNTNTLERLVILRDAEIAVLKDRIETLELGTKSS